MNNLLTRLRAEMQRQRAFLSDAAHELRTPLTALTLQIGNLRGVSTDPALAERLDDLQAGAHRAAALTNQLLRIARYDSVEGPLAAGTGQPRRYRLGRRRRAGAAGREPRRRSRHHRAGGATAAGSPADFRAMIEVLVDNAVRYTPGGGTVDVSVGPAAAGAAVVVRDSGPGVPEELLPRLPERFFRGPDVEAEGSGLGLAIARSIAARHAVELTLANRDGGAGFVATLTFPG